MYRQGRRGSSQPPSRYRCSLSFCLLCLFLAVLWLAGGASRPDVLGQAVVRLAAWLALITTIIFAPRPAIGGKKPIVIMMAAALALPLVQLIPLPPAIWQALPGRSVFAAAASLSGESQPWRPLAIVPGAAANAAESLVVPVVVLILLCGLRTREERWLPSVMLGFVTASALLGVLQFSGAAFSNPLINDSVGEVSSNFANRNHFAVFLAFGFPLVSAWAFADGRRPGWRGPIAIGLVLLFTMILLAVGSRAGIVAGSIGIGLGLAMAWSGLKAASGRYPRWVLPALIAALVAAACIVIAVVIAADRANSIQRAFAMDASQDLRRQNLAAVLGLVRAYFPLGAGLGGFDPIFRLHEPFELLKETYFNHAHNDFLELVIDAGVLGLALSLAAAILWLVASVKAWRSDREGLAGRSRLGSAILGLIFVASFVDYPARTPMIMAMIVVAAVWLCDGRGKPSTLPAKAGSI